MAMAMQSPVEAEVEVGVQAEVGMQQHRNHGLREEVSIENENGQQWDSTNPNKQSWNVRQWVSTSP
jgi:hypothetical protein